MDMIGGPRAQKKAAVALEAAAEDAEPSIDAVAEKRALKSLAGALGVDPARTGKLGAALKAYLEACYPSLGGSYEDE